MTVIFSRWASNLNPISFYLSIVFDQNSNKQDASQSNSDALIMCLNLKPASAKEQDPVFSRCLNFTVNFIVY